MKKTSQIMEVELPVPEAADLSARAAFEGIPVAKYLGIQVLSGAYGHLHPDVVAFNKRSDAGVSGTETRAGDEAPANVMQNRGR